MSGLPFVGEARSITFNPGSVSLAARFEAATGDGVRIGVIDSGRDPRWEEPRIRPGIGLVAPRGFALSRSLDDGDRIGHGTSCADLILRLAPGARIYPIKVFHRRLETSIEVLVEAIRWAVAQGLHLINLSLGTHQARALRPLYEACEFAHQEGVIVVSAFRHWGGTARGASYPAVFDHVIGVEAGPWDQEFAVRQGHAVECVVRGRCRARCLDGVMRTRTGSSFAAPQVTAFVARLLEAHPGVDLDRIRRLLAEVADTSLSIGDG